MGEAMTLISQLTGVLLVAALLSSLISSVLYRPVRSTLAAFSPHTRAAATLSYALITPAVVLVAMLSNSGTTPWLMLEHCHGNECGTHAPLLTLGSIGNVGLTTGALLLMLGLGIAVLKALVLGRRQLLTLFNLGRRQQDYVVVDSDHMLAWCCGLLRPKVVLSRALLQKLTREEVNVVLAHERTHVSRLDNLRNAAGRWCTSLWPREVRKLFRAELSAHNEACCDAIAMANAPDLFQDVVTRLAIPRPCTAGRHQSSFGTEHALPRVEAARTTDKHALPAYLLVTSVWVLQAILVSVAAHYLVEAVAAGRF